MAKTLTLADIEIVARHMVPEWWDSLTAQERQQVVDQYNEAQAAEDFMARQVEGQTKTARRA